MHVVIRRYPNHEVANQILKNKGEVEQLIRQVPGFISWSLVKLGDACVTATTCQDKAGCDRSVQVAREWVSKSVPNAPAPKVEEGEVVHRFLA